MVTMGGILLLAALTVGKRVLPIYSMSHSTVCNTAAYKMINGTIKPTVGNFAGWLTLINNTKANHSTTAFILVLCII